MPAYALQYRLEKSGVLCLVDAFSEVGKVLEPEDLNSEESDGDFFEPTISRERAHEIGRDLILRGVLYRRRPAGFSLDAPTSAVVVQYPYWVYYYRRRNLIDIRVLDAVTGEKTGHKIKLGILDAFQQQARADKDTQGDIGD